MSVMKKFVASITLVAGLYVGAFAAPAAAYEWQNGAGINCATFGPSYLGTVQMRGFGDLNAYTYYGFVAGQYNIPFNTASVFWADTFRASYPSSAGEAENYVDWVTNACFDWA